MALVAWQGDFGFIYVTVQDFRVQSNKILGEKDLHRGVPMTHRDHLVALCSEKDQASASSFMPYMHGLSSSKMEAPCFPINEA